MGTSGRIFNRRKTVQHRRRYAGHRCSPASGRCCRWESISSWLTLRTARSRLWRPRSRSNNQQHTRWDGQQDRQRTSCYTTACPPQLHTSCDSCHHLSRSTCKTLVDTQVTRSFARTNDVTENELNEHMEQHSLLLTEGGMGLKRRALDGGRSTRGKLDAMRGAAALSASRTTRKQQTENRARSRRTRSGRNAMGNVAPLMSTEAAESNSPRQVDRPGQRAPTVSGNVGNTVPTSKTTMLDMPFARAAQLRWDLPLGAPQTTCEIHLLWVMEVQV